MRSMEKKSAAEGFNLLINALLQRFSFTCLLILAPHQTAVCFFFPLHQVQDVGRGQN